MSSAATGFIIIGRNEGDRLIRCFDALPRAHGTVVYVDSGSTDGSLEAAEQRNIHVVKLDIEKPFTAGRARNEGFAALQQLAPDTAFVQFIDGDCELAPDWINTASTFLTANPKVAVVCGRRRERFPENSIYNRLCDREWNTPIGQTDACGGDAMMRVDAFTSVDGYTSELIAGEEPELCERLRGKGWMIWRIDAAMTLHDAAILHLRQWWMRGVRSGFGYAQVNAATAARPKPLYRSELRRAMIWAGALPASSIVAFFAFWPLALALLALYPLQIVRIAQRTGGGDRWAYALFMVLAKFPELQGALRYWQRARAGRGSDAILYK